jgi:hypothetical protein
MKKIGILSVLILSVTALIISGCATSTVHYNFDPKFRFSELSDYDWLNSPSSGQAVNKLAIKQIKSSVDRQLGEKGYSMDILNPDFLIAIHGGREKKVGVVDWDSRYGGNVDYDSGYDNPDHRLDVYEYEEGTLILDFVDAASRKLIWRGSVTKVISPGASPNKREKVINEAVARVLEKFPSAVN